VSRIGALVRVCTAPVELVRPEATTALGVMPERRAASCREPVLAPQ
jgi:hypothetical protein